MELDITLIIVFVAGLLFGGLSKLVELVGIRAMEARKTVPAEWSWLVGELADTGVKAAEQVWRGQEGKAAEKFEYAYNFVKIELAQRGLKFSETAVDALIEAKVFELFNQFRGLTEAEVE
jgi:hypothetical protein